MSAKTGLRRDTIDKFYTKPEVVKICIELVKSFVGKDDFIIEPSAGNGAFFELQTLANTLFLDIEPEDDRIQQGDFLSFKPPHVDKIHVIGNPPFGRQSSLARKFIKHSCSFSTTIGFILPRSFKKSSYQASFDKSFHLVEEFDLPSNSFTYDGKDYDVPCVFQVWKRSDTNRPIKHKLKPTRYEFVNSEDADVSFRRVGVYAGTFSEDTNKSKQSHYFIKFLDGYNIDRLNSIQFDNNNTVGPRSISKQELIEKLNNL